MTRQPHAQLHLPPRSPDEALVFVNILDRLITAIWRAHGPAMEASSTTSTATGRLVHRRHRTNGKTARCGCIRLPLPSV